MNIAAVGGDMAAYGLKMKGNMLNSTSDRFRQANKQIADLVIKMGLPDEVKSKAQVWRSARYVTCARSARPSILMARSARPQFCSVQPRRTYSVWMQSKAKCCQVRRHVGGSSRRRSA